MFWQVTKYFHVNHTWYFLLHLIHHIFSFFSEQTYKITEEGKFKSRLSHVEFTVENLLAIDILYRYILPSIPYFFLMRTVPPFPVLPLAVDCNYTHCQLCSSVRQRGSAWTNWQGWEALFSVFWERENISPGRYNQLHKYW